MNGDGLQDSLGPNYRFPISILSYTEMMGSIPFLPSDRDAQSLMQFTPNVNSRPDLDTTLHGSNPLFGFAPMMMGDTPAAYPFFESQNPEDLMSYPQPSLPNGFINEQPFSADLFASTAKPATPEGADALAPPAQPQKRRPGRPKGSHNKNPRPKAKTRSRAKLIYDADGNLVRRKRGRPRKDEQVALATAAIASAPAGKPDFSSLPTDAMSVLQPIGTGASMMESTPLDIPMLNPTEEAFPPAMLTEAAGVESESQEKTRRGRKSGSAKEGTSAELSAKNPAKQSATDILAKQSATDILTKEPVEELVSEARADDK